MEAPQVVSTERWYSSVSVEFVMVPPRAICRFVPWPFAAAICTLFLLSSISCSSNATSPQAKPVAVDSEFNVPDGTPSEIIAFVENIKKRKPKFKNNDESMAFAVNAQKAFISAGDKILKQETSPEIAANAAKMKMAAMFMLAEGQIEDFSKQLIGEVTKLKQDKRPSVAQLGEMLWRPAQVMSAPAMTSTEREKLTDELFADLPKAKYSQESVGALVQLANTLGSAGKPEDGGAIYERLAKIASESKDANFRSSAEIFQATARRIQLPGNKFVLNGKMLTGEEINWDSYRGKVVLIDYWATWCGPCLQELPNVKKNYEKYHDKGFDVIGISLDESRSKLQEFVDQQKIPWPQMFDDSRDMGWAHPMAKYYGISSVPTAILVDKDGNVVSMSARGGELSALLEKLLGKAN